MPEQGNLPRAYEEGTRLQFLSADLIRRSAELRDRTVLAHQRFEAARRRVLELKKRIEYLR